MISLIVVITINLAPAPAQFDKAQFDVDTFAPMAQPREVGVWDESRWDECVFE